MGLFEMEEEGGLQGREVGRWVVGATRSEGHGARAEQVWQVMESWVVGAGRERWGESEEGSSESGRMGDLERAGETPSTMAEMQGEGEGDHFR